MLVGRITDDPESTDPKLCVASVIQLWILLPDADTPTGVSWATWIRTVGRSGFECMGMGMSTKKKKRYNMVRITKFDSKNEYPWAVGTSCSPQTLWPVCQEYVISTSPHQLLQ